MVFNTGRKKKVTIKSDKTHNHNRRSSEATLKLLYDNFWNKVKDWVLNKSRTHTKDYLENATIHCLHYIGDEDLMPWEKRMWRLLHAVSLGVAIWIMWQVGGAAILTPVAVSRVPTAASLHNVPHPAIAVCSLNRISRQKAADLATKLIQTKSLNYTVDGLVGLMGFLGLAYDLETSDSNQLETLHYILEPYNLEQLLKDLTPKCDDIIKRCTWRGQLVNCSHIFTMRKTMDGFCCTFNYRREADTGEILNQTQSETLMALSGMDRGLSVLMDPHLEDYLYTKNPHEGMKMFVFNPDDYPDLTSGQCVQQSLAPQTELYVNLEAILLTSTKAVENLDINTRGCLTKEDSKTYLDSYSDCVVNCRIRSIIPLCGCVPFYLPIRKGNEICSLLDNVCLKRWKDNWWEAWSGEDVLPEYGEIAGDVQPPPCDFCLPSCGEAVYRARQHAVPIQIDSINALSENEKSVLKKNITFGNHSIVHMYFSKDNVLHMEHGLLSQWYDLLSAMGGVAALFLGGSLISLMEIVYFIFGGPVKKNRGRRSEMRQLYWEELRNYKMS